MSGNGGEYTHRVFTTLIADAIEHAYLAKSVKEPGSVGRLARSAILNTAISVEAAANDILFSMELPKKCRDHFERARPLDKFEFFAHVRVGKQLDRGRAETQKVAEIISLRNSFVHPKVTRHPVTATQEGSKNVTAKLNYRLTRHLRIPPFSHQWNGEHAVAAVGAVCEFLNMFCLDLCNLSPNEATELLASFIDADGKRGAAFVGGEAELLRKANSLWKIEFRFIAT